MKCSRLFRPSLIAALLLGGFFSSLRGASKIANPGDDLNAIINSMASGDVLVLKDGNHRPISINGKSGITIRAENERRANIFGDGLTRTLFMNNCSNIVLEGLRLKGADNNGSGTGDVASIYNSNYITVRRFLLTHSNRYKNAHLFENANLSNSLFEENEFYFFHRHALSLTVGSGNVYRRNYANGKSYPDIAGGNVTGYTPGGDDFIALYPGNGNIIENNISEGCGVGSVINATGNADNNSFYGDISLNEEYGFNLRARGTGDAAMPHNTSFTNCVAINPKYAGIYSRSAKNTQVRNCSAIGGASSIGHGIVADQQTPETGDGNYSAFVSNSLSTGFSQNYGFYVATNVGSWSFKLDYVNSFGNAAPFNPSAPNPNITRALTVNPNLGSAKIFIPAGSPLKGAGSGGADIGANIIYRYQNGTLTNTPLWQSDGSFPHGAVIAGVNDGQGAANVHTRLGTMPGVVGGQQQPTPPPPATGVTVSQNSVPTPQPSTPGASPAIGVPLLIGGVILAALFLGGD